MTKQPVEQQPQLFLLDRSQKRASLFESLRPRIVSNQADVVSCLPHATADSLWVSYARNLTEALVKGVSWPRSTSLGSGVFLHPLETESVPPLTSCFRRIAFLTNGGFLPPEELAEVLGDENRNNLFLGGSTNHSTETITFWRGNLAPLTVPFSAFEKAGDGTKPDFHTFSIIDCGQTVQLGEYEAATDALLYEYDPNYRRELSKQRLQEDRSFGAALRRLRKQRGLRREDFEPDLNAKTIARIEQGKVSRIQKKTLAALAKHLKVEPEEIAEF